MIALDTNFLIYAHRDDNPFHVIARTALEKLAAGLVPWGLPVFCVHEFLAVLTNPKIFAAPTPNDLAFAQIQALLERRQTRLLLPTPEHVNVLQRITQGQAIRGAQFHDARIAALCVEHGVSELWTADRDFKAYAQLTTKTPQQLVQVGS